jgi:hypothetical protein
VQAYLDAGFLLTLLVRAPGRQLASQLLKEIETPIALNFLHQLQTENLLVNLQVSLKVARKAKRDRVKPIPPREAK